MVKNQRFCPNCGSTHVEFDTDHTNQLGEMIANLNKWKCNECSYKGPMPVKDPDAEKEQMEEIEFEPVEQKTIDTDWGKAEIKVLIYITIPVTVLTALYYILVY